mmetsp:Transcript_82376/g.237940  ORF Transcript_82376/g.237940 Transcript_82376/m.237940 type:complete len:321 (+) Transcript_82376:1376-2338(+)
MLQRRPLKPQLSNAGVHILGRSDEGPSAASVFGDVDPTMGLLLLAAPGLTLRIEAQARQPDAARRRDYVHPDEAVVARAALWELAGGQRDLDLACELAGRDRRLGASDQFVLHAEDAVVDDYVRLFRALADLLDLQGNGIALGESVLRREEPYQQILRRRRLASLADQGAQGGLDAVLRGALQDEALSVLHDPLHLGRTEVRHPVFLELLNDCLTPRLTLQRIASLAATQLSNVGQPCEEDQDREVHERQDAFPNLDDVRRCNGENHDEPQVCPNAEDGRNGKDRRPENGATLPSWNDIDAHGDDHHQVICRAPHDGRRP